MYNYVNVLFSIELCIYKNKKKKKKKVSFHVPFGIILFII